VQAAQEAIYSILRKHTGHEFSGYKEKTFVRRVHRRMQEGELLVDALARERRRVSRGSVKVIRSLGCATCGTVVRLVQKRKQRGAHIYCARLEPPLRHPTTARR
jgi:CheR methyltransferase, all-alpha domain